MATRNSRAGPTAFLAADNKDSCTAPARTSRLMPFSRSQNSSTARKSAFIRLCTAPKRGTKKSVDDALPTLARWQTSNYRSPPTLGSWPKTVKPLFPAIFPGFLGYSAARAGADARGCAWRAPGGLRGGELPVARIALPFAPGCSKLRPMTQPLALVVYERLLPG